MVRFERKHKVDPAFNYASLTDIVLQLLIFFLLSSSFVVTSGIKVQLPKAQTGESQTDKQTVVTLTNAGKLYLNTEEITTGTLGQKLIALLDKNPNQLIIVKADKDVSLQSTIEIVDIAKGVGAQRFMLATEPAEK